MRILHTSDWHLGKTLEKRSREQEQEKFIQEIIDIAEREKVDLIIIAGDIFDTSNPPAYAEQLFYDGIDGLAAGGRRGIVAIAGNHDNPERLIAARSLATRYGISILGLPKDSFSPWALRDHQIACPVAGGPSWLEIAIPGLEYTAVVLALPYPSEGRLNQLLTSSMEETEQQKAYSKRVKQIFTSLSSNYRKDTVNLATSHLFVAGGKEADERPIHLGGACTVSPDALPEQAQYIALGHLHRAQKVAGTNGRGRYSGSPLAYSFSEVNQVKSVFLIDVKPQKPAHVEQIPITSGKPLVKWQVVNGISQLEEWCTTGKDANAWIDLELHLNKPLQIDEIQSIHRMHQGIVSVRPVFANMWEQKPIQGRSEMSVSQLFTEFYLKERGVEPDPQLLKLFLQLAAEGDDNNSQEVIGNETSVS